MIGLGFTLRRSNELCSNVAMGQTQGDVLIEKKPCSYHVVAEYDSAQGECRVVYRLK